MSLLGSVVGFSKAIRTGAKISRRSKAALSLEVAYARLFLNIGPLYYSLFSLHQWPIKVWGNYMLDQEANAIVRKINSPAARLLVTDKLGFYRRLSALNLPTIAVLAVITNLTDGGHECDIAMISTVDQFTRFSDEFPDHLFFKTIDGSHGDDAFTATRQCDYWIFDGKKGKASDLYTHCILILGDRSGWLIQAKVSAHVKLVESLSPGALGTVRIVSVLRRERVSIVAALLKIPVGNSVTDNFSKGANGNIVAPINLETGRLGLGQMSNSRIWPEIVSIDRHPDTGCKISGFELPFWSEALSLVSHAQRNLKEAPTLGWDIALTDTGPVVVEANAGYGVEIHEVAEQKGLRSLLLEAWRFAGDSA